MAVTLTLPEAVGVVLGGPLLTQVGNWLAGRSRNKAYIMGAVDHSVAGAMAAMDSTVENLREEVSRLRGQMADEAAACEVKLAAMRLEIETYMSAQPIAEYTKITRPLEGKP